MGFTRGGDFSPSSSQDRPHHGYPPALLLLGISKRPPLFPVVKLCLSKLHKPSPPPSPAQPRSAVPEVIFMLLPACCHPLPSLPSPPAPAAHTRRYCRAGRAISSPRRERSSAPERALCLSVSLPPQQKPPAAVNFFPISARPGLALQGSPSLGRGQLACPQTCPRPLGLNTCSGCGGARPVVVRGGRGEAAAWRGPPSPVSSPGTPTPEPLAGAAEDAAGEGR